MWNCWGYTVSHRSCTEDGTFPLLFYEWSTTSGRLLANATGLLSPESSLWLLAAIDWAIYNSYKEPYKRELEKRLSERPVFLTTEQFQTINLDRRLNKVSEQRFKVVLPWGSFHIKWHWMVFKAGDPSYTTEFHSIKSEGSNKALV